MMNHKIKPEDVTVGTYDMGEFEARMLAQDLIDKGYRRTSNAYCHVNRIDRDDWLDVLAKERRCSRADFYNQDGSGIGDQHRDYYVRVHSKDQHTVPPIMIRMIPAWR